MLTAKGAKGRQVSNGGMQAIPPKPASACPMMQACDGLSIVCGLGALCGRNRYPRALKRASLRLCSEARLGPAGRLGILRGIGLAGPQHLVGDLLVAVFAQFEHPAEQGLEGLAAM